MMGSRRMLGRIHGPNCDCNIEQHVSGVSEKCNYRHGVKRQRSREKREVAKEIKEENK